MRPLLNDDPLRAIFLIMGWSDAVAAMDVSDHRGGEMESVNSLM